MEMFRSTSSIMDSRFVSRDLRLSGTSFSLRIIVSVLVWSVLISPHARVSAQVEGNKISCDVPSVAPMTNTLLTCHFPEDVSHTRRDLTVYKYNSDQTPDAVLDCWWLLQKLECFVGQGYKYDGRISDKLSLEIPRVSPSHISTYACQLSSYGSDAINTCDLTLSSVGRSVCEVSSVNLKSQTALFCYFPEDISKTKTGFTVYHYSRQGAQDAVLSCNWERDDVKCNTAQGFQFDRKVSDHLTLEIPSASEAHEGTYSCQSTGVKSFPYENCNFTLKKAKTSSCTIASVKEMEPTELTCIFNVDVSMTRQDFKVVRLYDGGTSVVSCTWPDDKLVCTTTPGYEFSNIVTDRLVVKIPQATPEQSGTYACHLQTFDLQSFESCEFVISKDSVNAGVIVGVIIGVVVMITLVIATIILLRKLRKSSKKEVSEEEHGMLPRKNKDIKMDFINLLSTSCKKMYGDIATSFHFVPYLYINRNKYKVVHFAGEKVFITEECSKTDLSHDKAMQKILHNLHLLAEGEKEAMFVISQFNYDSYLTTPIKKQGHQLPMPATLRKYDKDYGDFDLLVVHRQYGLIVAVVKSCGAESGDSTETIDDTKLLEEIRNGNKLLKDAENMIQHLLSDQQWTLPVRKTLMLPNVSQQTVEDVLSKQNKEKTEEEIALNLSCTNMSQDNYLFTEQLTSVNSTQSLKHWLQSGSTRVFNDEHYLTVISRFCGPATRSPLPVPGTIPRDILPVTPEHAVCLTGDLFTSTILHKKHMAVLEHPPPRVLLCGPPGTGKTRMLVLIGKRWRSQGHDVHVVSTWETSRAASRLLYEILNKGVKKTLLRTGSVTLHDVDLNSKNATDVVDELSRLAMGGKLFILCDEAEPERDASSLRSVCEKLLEKVPNLHLWYASCFHSNMPEDWTGTFFMDPISVPPAILQEKEVSQAAVDCKIHEWALNSRSQPPTEGPAVKHVLHRGDGHSAGDPHDCETCCIQVVGYLQSLITDKTPYTSTSTPVAGNILGDSPKATRLPGLRLNDGDVLVLTECHLKEEVTFFKKLRESGFKTTKLQAETFETLFEDNSNCVLIAEGKQLRGFKRKIVVYLEAKCTDSKAKTEGRQGQKESSSVKLNRLRGLTSCTSQLIWVKVPYN